MRKVIAGDGTDSTSAVLSWLAANNNLRLANVYLIGKPEDPLALWLTDYESPLCWPCWTSEKKNPNGTANAFDPAVITRGTVTSKIGLEVESLDLTWSPVNKTYTTSIATASPYQLASPGYYDNWEVRVWTVYMPTPGDANTLGCSELFGGRIGDTTVIRGQIKWKVNSFLDVVNQNVPTNVIELLNTGAAYTGATPPAGYSHIPQFTAKVGSSTNVIVGAQTYPNPGSTLSANSVRGGFLVFNGGPGATLTGIWSAILQNATVTTGGGGGTHEDQFILASPLPWPPTADVDTFYVSAAAPINQSDGEYIGFPYVPAPQASF